MKSSPFDKRLTPADVAASPLPVATTPQDASSSPPPSSVPEFKSYIPEIPEEKRRNAEDLSKSEKSEFNNLIRKAQEADKSGDVITSLTLFAASLHLCYREKVVTKMRKMEEKMIHEQQRVLENVPNTHYLRDTVSGNYVLPFKEDCPRKEVTRGEFVISKDVYQKLFPYQREGKNERARERERDHFFFA
jgi:hypothetical protein